MDQENKIRISVIEDDQWYREYLCYTLSLDPDCEVHMYASGKEFLNTTENPSDIITVDYGLPDMTGAEVLETVKKKFPDCEVIVISEQDKVDTALQLLKAGAYDYFVKSNDIRERLLNCVNHIKKGTGLKKQISKLELEVKGKYDFRKHLIGTSPAMQKVFDLIGKAIGNNLTVTITGETGTGKEEVAKAIHYNSGFSKGPFVAINVAAIPKELAESELFGHEKGSFTGASAQRIGKFEEAADGTLFLDEIGDLDPALQVKLLRVLQEKTIHRIGNNNTIRIRSRVIVATHKDLLEEVRSGRFREDLYYRIFGLTIQLPPLRERGHDVLVLANYFAAAFCKENNMKTKTLGDSCIEKLLHYRFPGNVRELKSLIELACVLTSNNLIEADDIQLPASVNGAGFFAENLTLDEYNRKIIRHYLEIYSDNVMTVAQKLGIGKSTIYRMMKDGKGL